MKEVRGDSFWLFRGFKTCTAQIGVIKDSICKIFDQEIVIGLQNETFLKVKGLFKGNLCINHEKQQSFYEHICRRIHSYKH